MRQVRVAVIGAGGAAQVVHLPILKRLPDLEVVGLIDQRGRTGRAIAERFAVPAVGADLSALSDFGPLEAVVVCTPTDTHEEVAIAALEAGLHVLCERPLATSSASAARMVEAARRADRQLMTAMNLRYRFDARAVRQFVANGELGEVYLARATWLNESSRGPKRGWRRDASRAGGGVLMDLGAQAIDLALWVLGFPDVVRVMACFHGGEVEDSAVALLSLADGGAISVETSWEFMARRDRHALAVLGKRGTATTSPFRVVKELPSGLADVTPPLQATAGRLYRDSYRQEWGEFLRRVRGEQDLRFEDDQVVLHRILEACYRSAESGADVAVV